jgi:subtilisin family serine protease
MDAADRTDIKVINMSYGSSYPVKIPAFELETDPEYQALMYATTKDKVLVAAAGNDGNNAYSYPASYPNVISAAATTSNDSRASFSQYNDEVELCAPGANVMTLNTNGGYGSVNGTSFSSPIVAGSAAVLFAEDPSLTATDVRAVLDCNTQNVGGNRDYFGNGKRKSQNIYTVLILLYLEIARYIIFILPTMVCDGMIVQ